MKINTAEFLMSNTDYRKCPDKMYHEYAFIGRSNVGKSSLINMLTGNRKLAKTSSTPGKTREINHFLINNNWYLVDLPGYGYAKVAKTARAKWTGMIEQYLLNRKNLITLFVLIDSRIPPQKIDLEFMETLGVKQIPFSIIFTKIDKISNTVLSKNIDEYRLELLKTWDFLPDIFLSSAKSAEGKEEILEYINKLNLEITLE